MKIFSYKKITKKKKLMAEGFNNFSCKIVSLIRRQNLNADITEIFSQYVNNIIDQELLNKKISDNKNKFLNETVPKVVSILLSSLAMNTTQLQYSITLMDCLNRLALWGMLNSKESLVNNLLGITNSNASFYEKNTFQHPNLFIEKVHYFFTSPLWEKLNDKMAAPENFQVSMLFTIYSFVFQYCSSCNSSDEIVSKVIFKYQKFFCDFVNKMDDETLSKCLPSILVIIIKSLNKIYSEFDLHNDLPSFMKFFSRSAKSENIEKQLSALSILNSYALSEDDKIVENFNEWKEETDLVSSLIKMDLSFEALQASKDLIEKAIHDDELVEFLNKAKSWFIAQRQFSFHLISQIMVERRDIDLMTKLTREPIDIEFLCILLIEIFKSKKEELLSRCKSIVDLIFEIGGVNLAEFSPRIVLFYKELNEIDQNRNDPNITSWRIRILARFIRMLGVEDFVDQICNFLSYQFEELHQISLLQPSTDLFDDIQDILKETLTKAQSYYVFKNSVSEAMIRLFYIIVLFKNINFIGGQSNHIHIKEPSNIECFDFALDALIHCNDQSVADVAIELFSQFFSQTDFFSESITNLYNFCIHHLRDGIDQMVKYRLLKLIYKVLVDLEGNYELIDFENLRRNHKNDTKGKIMFKVKNGENHFEIYAKPNSIAVQLIYRIAMRLRRTADVLRVTDSNRNDIDPTCLVQNLDRQLNVICLENSTNANYSSASSTLWNQGFTTILLEILDNSSQPELTYITKRLLSFLPCDQNIMQTSVEDYLQMINDTRNDEKIKYLLHCFKHFDRYKMKDIGDQIHVIWGKLKLQTRIISAVFEFFFYLINDKFDSSWPMFLGGRVFRSFILHDRKSYKIGADLYIKKLNVYINLNDINIIKQIIISCDDEGWPYLSEIIKSFYSKNIVFSACVEEFLNSKLKHKFIIKTLVMLIKEDSNLMIPSKNFDDFFGIINQLDNCNTDEFIDVIRFITDHNKILSHEYFQNHHEELNKMIILGFKKGSFEAEELILRLYASVFDYLELSQATSNIKKQLFDQKFNVWNYKPTGHLQNKHGIGLKNIGSTCYINSLFQVLNRIPEFLNEIFASSDPSLQSLQWVLASLQKSNRDYIDPSIFIAEWNGWKGQNIDPNIEQDVTEFYHYLIQSCPESASNLFIGEQTIKYNGENGLEKVVSEQFFSLSVKINGFTNLVQSICSMVEPEIVSNFCNENGNKITVTKSLKITQCPKVLVIQLNRFEFDHQNQRKAKNDQKFEFPEHLNIIPLLQDEKNTFYSLHSIICHSEGPNKGYYALLHEDKKYHKAANIFKAKDEKWIRIQNQTIAELPNGYQNESFGEACLLFYVLDDFLTENGGASPEVKIGNDLCNTIHKENETFGMMQTLFSIEVPKFLKDSTLEEPYIYYLYNVLMHGSSEFKDYIDHILECISIKTAIDYTYQNFTNFLEIFEHQVPAALIDPFLKFSCKMMERRESVPILNDIIDVLSLDLINEHAIEPLLKLVYSYLKANGPSLNQFNIIYKLVEFVVSCIKQDLSLSIKIDDAFLSLTKLLNFGENSSIDTLRYLCKFKLIEDNFQLIPDHLSNIESLNGFVEQAIKYNLIEAKNLS